MSKDKVVNPRDEEVKLEAPVPESYQGPNDDFYIEEDIETLGGSKDQQDW